MHLCRDTIRLFFWPGGRFLAFDEDALPGFEERIIENAGDSEIEEL